MCSEGYPAVDVFDMTGATPNQPQHAAGFDYSVLKPVENTLKHYFETRTSKRCMRDKVFRKVKQEERIDVQNQIEAYASGSGSGKEAEDMTNTKQANSTVTNA